MTEKLEFAGDRITLRYTATGTELSFDDKGTGRVCGKCQLCCKLVPVPTIELQKAAGERCRYSKVGKGCTIYARRPNACRGWTCRWLSDPDTAGMSRPDACHYVIDMEEDYIEHVDTSGTRTKIGVIQVWVDPAFPNSHRDPQLRAYLARQAEKFRVAAIIRYDSRRAISLFAPVFADDGQWHEITDQTVVVNRDPIDRVVEVLADRHELIARTRVSR